MGDVYLADFTRLAQSCREGGSHFEGFRRNASVIALRWPDDVLEQWLYDHSVLRDYGIVDLSAIGWEVEVIPLEKFIAIPTGPSDGDCVDQYASNPDHWISARRYGIHIGVAQCWETHGTWKRWPILIDRLLLDPPASGLQVVEGRTCVEVLKGRHRRKDLVAQRHLAWVGRSRITAASSGLV